MRAGWTSRPPATLAMSTRIASVARNASGMTRRRLALSSSVRSNHCVAAVFAAVQVAGAAFIWRAVATIDPLDLAGIRAAQREMRLQTRGPYALVRHPLYLGWILIVFGASTMSYDRLLFATLSSAYLLAAIPWEEGTLLEAFGGEYARYRQRVRWRVIPRIY